MTNCYCQTLGGVLITAIKVGTQTLTSHFRILCGCAFSVQCACLQEMPLYPTNVSCALLPVSHPFHQSDVPAGYILALLNKPEFNKVAIILDKCSLPTHANVHAFHYRRSCIRP